MCKVTTTQEDEIDVVTTSLGSESTASTVVQTNNQNNRITFTETEIEQIYEQPAELAAVEAGLNEDMEIGNDESLLSKNSQSSYVGSSSGGKAISSSSSTDSDAPLPSDKPVEDVKVDNESVIVDEFEYQYKEDDEDEPEQLVSMPDTEDDTNKQTPADPLVVISPPPPQDSELNVDIGANSSTESVSTSATPCSSTSHSSENRLNQTNENVVVVAAPLPSSEPLIPTTSADLDEDKINPVEVESPSSRSSSNDGWFDVQKAIEEYRISNLEPENDDDQPVVDEQPTELDQPTENELKLDQLPGNLLNNEIITVGDVLSADVDDVFIDCKINYRLKEDTDDADESSSSSSGTDSASSLSSERKHSDYDNLSSQIILTNANKHVTSSTTAILSTSHNESLASLSETQLNNVADASTSNVIGDASNPLNGALSSSMNSINSNDSSSSSSSNKDNNNTSNNNQNNETLASFTSMNNSNDCLNKSYDEEETIEYNFVEDFTDLSKELDENWIQEDELWFSNNLLPPSSSANKSALSASNPFVSIHPPRILHRIEEEPSLCSESDANVETNMNTVKQFLGEDEDDDDSSRISSSSESTDSSSETGEIVLVKKEASSAPTIVVQDNNNNNSNNPFEQFNQVDEFKISLDYKIRKFEDAEQSDGDDDQVDQLKQQQANREKLRTQQCNLDSLLGFMSSSDGEQQLNAESANVGEQEKEQPPKDEQLIDIGPANEELKPTPDVLPKETDQQVDEDLLLMTEIDASEFLVQNSNPNGKDENAFSPSRHLNATENDASDIESDKEGSSKPSEEVCHSFLSRLIY